jgi:hypothetical protein
MSGKRFTNLVFSFLVLLATLSSCQKDDAVKTPETIKPLATDSSKATSLASSPGNFLAVSGTLTIRFHDSTYTFDASKDSIAFINVHVNDNTRYFGITAINKAHTISFGVSSSGFINSFSVYSVAGGQLLLNPANKLRSQEYALSKFTGQNDTGAITVEAYLQAAQLIKGSFYTFLAVDDKANTPFYKAEGSFDLKLK